MNGNVVGPLRRREVDEEAPRKHPSMVPRDSQPFVSPNRSSNRTSLISSVPGEMDEGSNSHLFVLCAREWFREHTIFDCPRWDASRLRIGEYLGGGNPSPNDMSDPLCGPDLPIDMEPVTRCRLKEAARRANAAVTDMITEIITEKEADERQLQKLLKRSQ